MKRYVKATNDNLDNLPNGRYLVKYGRAYYELSFDFHNCTYSLFPVNNPNGHVENFLSQEEVDDIVHKGGFKVTTINRHPYG